jgi:hypothetical protein
MDSSEGHAVMSRVAVVRPASGRIETGAIATIAVLILTASGVYVSQRESEDSLQRLFDWQISAFYDMNATDQAIYNALTVASEELWWIHGDLLFFANGDMTAETWPTVEELNEYYVLPPFARDMAWSQQGEVEWERAAAFSFEGSTVYFGSGGKNEGQSAYLIMLSHVHKGASYADGATIWVHADPNVAMPTTVKRDSLIVNGWREVVPYSGAMEVERLKGA